MNCFAHRWALIHMCLLTFVALNGCGERRAAAVNVDLARATLIKVMEQWKQGKSIESLRQESPEIIVQESMWREGKALQGYRLIGDGRAEDANWFCEVELTFLSEDVRKPMTRTVTYVVGTDPVLTVFHAIL